MRVARARRRSRGSDALKMISPNSAASWRFGEPHAASSRTRAEQRSCGIDGRRRVDIVAAPLQLLSVFQRRGSYAARSRVDLFACLPQYRVCTSHEGQMVAANPIRYAIRPGSGRMLVT